MGESEGGTEAGREGHNDGQNKHGAVKKRRTIVFIRKSYSPVALRHFGQIGRGITYSSLQRPQLHLPKIFGEFRQRYQDRAGGYTRVSRIEPVKEDHAESAILEMVDGRYDMKFHLTARMIAYRMSKNLALTELCKQNIKKVTQFRKNGAVELKDLVRKFETLGEFKGAIRPKKKKYPNIMSPAPRELKVDILDKMKKQPWW